MKFTHAPLAGAWLIGLEPHEDERGFFARLWCAEEFGARGLETDVAQTSMSYNRRRGTLRGMHWQAAPHEETKVVRCLRGALYDVIIDLRPESATFTHHFAVELTAGNRLALYIPRGFAHGFQTLEDDTEVLYQMSVPYSPDHGRGVRWDDPAFGIRWPIVPPVMLARDGTYPDFHPERAVR